VVGEVRDVGLGKHPTPMVYVPIAQLTDGMAKLTSGGLPITWAIRTRTDPHGFRADIERELRAASGGLPVAHVRSMEPEWTPWWLCDGNSCGASFTHVDITSSEGRHRLEYEP
jgi:hypothetical protein